MPQKRCPYCNKLFARPASHARFCNKRPGLKKATKHAVPKANEQRPTSEMTRRINSAIENVERKRKVLELWSELKSAPSRQRIGEIAHETATKHLPSLVRVLGDSEQRAGTVKRAIDEARIALDILETVARDRVWEAVEE